MVWGYAHYINGQATYAEYYWAGTLAQGSCPFDTYRPTKIVRCPVLRNASFWRSNDAYCMASGALRQFQKSEEGVKPLIKMEDILALKHEDWPHRAVSVSHWCRRDSFHFPSGRTTLPTSFFPHCILNRDFWYVRKSDIEVTLCKYLSIFIFKNVDVIDVSEISDTNIQWATSTWQM